MAMESSESQEGASLRPLFPDLADGQLQEVQEFFHGYLNALWRVYERLRREQPQVFDSDKDPS